jgi:hypothetical protein
MATENMSDSVELDLAESLRLYRAPVSLAQSVSQRQSVRFAPQSTSSGFSPLQNKQITIRMSSQSYIDPQTAFLVFQFQTDSVGVIPQDCVLSLFDSCKLVAGGRTLESIANVDSISAAIFYGKTPREAILSGYGQLAGCNKFSNDRGAYLSVGTSTSNVQPINAQRIGTGTFEGTTGVPGMDAGATNLVPQGSGTSSTLSTIQNTQGFATSFGHSMMPGLAKVYSQDARNDVSSGYLETSGVQLNGNSISSAGSRARYFAIHLSSLFGLFSNTAYLNLRNMGILSVELTLGNRGVLNVLPLKTTDYTNPAVSYEDDATVRSKLTSGVSSFTLNNVFVYVDTVDPNPSLVERVDEMCAGDQGVSIVYDTISTSQFNVNYDTNLNLQIARSYSHVRDLYAVFRPSVLANNPVYSRVDQTYLGTRVKSYSSIIGSSTFPSIAVDSPQQAYLEFCKSFGHHSGHTASAIDFQAYIGATGVHSHHTSWTGLLTSIAAVRGGGLAALVQSTQSFSAAPSQYIVAQSYERVLGEGAHNLSGISTRLAGSVLSLNLNLKPMDASLVKATSTDCIIGDATLQCTLAVHCECLLRIANSSIMVAD